jgi:hypothetical protein
MRVRNDLDRLIDLAADLPGRLTSGLQPERLRPLSGATAATS